MIASTLPGACARSIPQATPLALPVSPPADAATASSDRAQRAISITLIASLTLTVFLEIQAPVAGGTIWSVSIWSQPSASRGRGLAFAYHEEVPRLDRGATCAVIFNGVAFDIEETDADRVEEFLQEWSA